MNEMVVPKAEDDYTHVDVTQNWNEEDKNRSEFMIVSLN